MGEFQRQIDFEKCHIKALIDEARFPDRNSGTLKLVLHNIEFLIRLRPRVKMELLAHKSGLSRKTAQRAVRRLEELGILGVDRTPRLGSGTGANGYEIYRERLADFCVAAPPEHKPAVAHAADHTVEFTRVGDVQARGQDVQARGQDVQARGQDDRANKESDLNQDPKPGEEPREAAPAKLLEVIDWWNGLRDQGAVASSAQRRPTDAVLRGWRRIEKSRDLREMFDDLPTLGDAIRASPFCSNGWFRLEKLLGGRNRDGELIVRKVLDGGYMQSTNARRSLRNCPTYREEDAAYGW